jgi:glycosyltransferase involved in cell wall biosynthesis
MIVKDESHVVERALQSALPFIECWSIVDTGSSDDTIAIIENFFQKHSVPGKVFRRPWRDFGFNRTEALDLCQGLMKWAIMLDADDTIEGELLSPDFFSDQPSSKSHDISSAQKPDETVNAMTIQIKFGQHEFRRIQFFRLDAKWRYVNKVHEYAVCDSAAHVFHLPSSTFMHARSEGAQSKDPIARAERDISLLLSEPRTIHNLFHLGNSYREAKRYDDALRCYRRIISFQSREINSEKYISMVNVIFFSTNPDEQIRITKAALELEPLRLEAPFNLLHRCRYSPNSPAPSNEELYEIANSSKSRESNVATFMVTPAIYDWLFDYEFAKVAFDVKMYAQAESAARKCLCNCPKEHQKDIQDLVDFLANYSSRCSSEGDNPVK